MDILVAKKIRLAIIKDDIKALRTLLTDKECLALSFGRFPLLSLAYLYGAERVINKFEYILKGITDYIVMPEETEDYLLFKKNAGKALRLYIGGQTITPIEMAAVVGDSLGVKAHLKDTLNTERVKKIYRLTHDKEVKKNGNSIVVPRSKKPTSKQLIAILTIIIISTICLSGGLVALEMVPIALGGEGTLENPLKITSPTLFDLALADTSNRYYTLTHDITIDMQEHVSQNLSINLDLGGHTILVKGAMGSSLINKLSGSLTNGTIKFVDCGDRVPANSALLTKELTGKAQNLSIYIEDFSFTATTECGLVAHSSTGTMSDIKLFANGTINEVSALEETVIGALLYKNAGVVSDIEATLDISLTGDAKGATSDTTAGTFGDAIFGGIVGLNNATLTRAKVMDGSKIVSDTLDLAGISATNGEKATMSDVTNNATLTQSTLTSYWSPNIGGITMRNYGKLTGATNNGTIQATTNQNQQNTSIILGGITTTNTGTIDNAKNTGAISGTMLAGALNIGGIAYLNEGVVTNTTNTGNISGTVTETEALTMEHHLAGGFAVNNGSITKIKNDGDIVGSFSTDSSAFVGGVVGLNNTQTASIVSSQNNGNITVSTTQTENKMVFVGGVVSYLAGTLTDSFNTGSFTSSSSEKAVVKGAVIGFTMVQSDIMGALYKYNSDWANCYYIVEQGYSVGIGNFFVRGVFSQSYMDGEDSNTTATDLDTLKNSGVYWQ